MMPTPFVLCLVHGHLDCLQTNDLAEAPAAFDHGQCLGFVHDGDVLTGDDIARFHPLYIFGDAQHAVGVVSGQVGLNQMFGHDAGLVPFHAGGDENILGRWRSVGARENVGTVTCFSSSEIVLRLSSSGIVEELFEQRSHAG